MNTFQVAEKCRKLKQQGLDFKTIAKKLAAHLPPGNPKDRTPDNWIAIDYVKNLLRALTVDAYILRLWEAMQIPAPVVFKAVSIGNAEERRKWINEFIGGSNA